MVFALSPSTLFILQLVTLVWLGVVSILLFKAITNYNRLTQGTTDKTLSEVLNKFLQDNRLTREEQQRVLGEIAKIRQESLKYIQKVGLVRFNPFSDTGGDQSFSLAMLDGEANGLVITSLYGRMGMRWYVKTIKAGKGVEFELSKEEKAALKKIS